MFSAVIIDDIVNPSEQCIPYEEDAEFSDDEMERLVAGVNRLDFTVWFWFFLHEFSSFVQLFERFSEGRVTFFKNIFEFLKVALTDIFIPR